MSSNVQDKLVSWGAWARAGRDNLGYPKLSISVPYVQDYANDHMKKAEFISDEDAMQIDGLIAVLKARDDLCGKVLIRYYLSGQNAIDTARACGVSRAHVYNQVKQGEAWLDGALCMIV